MNDEVWKDIKGYEGNYQVSNKGRVKSVSHKVTRGFCTCMTKEKILTAKKKKSKSGDFYFCLHLSKNGFFKNFHLHRIVAEAFVPNPNNFPQVDHIDGNKANNDASNLRWCTQSQNINNENTFYKSKRLVKVRCYTDKGEFGVFDSLSDASRATGVPISTISCIMSKTSKCNGNKSGFHFDRIKQP